MSLAFLFLSLLLLLLIGTPLGMALGLASMVTSLAFTDETLPSMALSLFETLQHHTLTAIPLFILLTALLSTGGVARRIIAFAVGCIGHLRGGLAMASALACIVLASMTGSSPVAIVTIGALVIVGMARAGYDAGLAGSVIGNAASMGALLPPSIVLVVYAVMTDTAIGRMFLAGLMPAVVVAIMLIGALLGYARLANLPGRSRAGPRQIRAAGRAVIWDLLPLAIILVGICTGWLTAAGAAAVAVAWAFVAIVLIDRDVGPLRDLVPYRPTWADRQAGGMGLAARSAVGLANLARILTLLPVAILHRDLRSVLIDAGRTTAVLMFVFVNATLFAHVLDSQGAGQTIAAAIAQWGLEPWALLGATSLMLLLVGQLMEPAAMVMVAAPVTYPIAVALGLDPVHLGVVMVVSIEIAMMTPPAGLGLFVTAGVAGMSRPAAIRAALPWLGVLVLFLALLIAFPPLSTLLPDLVYGPQIH